MRTNYVISFNQVNFLLKDTTASCPVIFNCQAGISRTTTAMVTAALVKELQLTRELDRMRGIVPDDILDALKKKKLGLPGIDFEVQEDRNAMQMGEFEVIKELLAAYPAAKIAKAQVNNAKFLIHFIRIMGTGNHQSSLDM